MAEKSSQLALVPQKGSLVPHKREEEIKVEEEKKKKELEEFQAKLRFIQEVVPTKVYNTMSSTAGAGSGEFHIYRLARAREQERLKRIDEHVQKEATLKEYEARQRERLEAAEAKTDKNRKRRMKKKEKQKSKKQKGPDSGTEGPSGGEDTGRGEEDGHGESEPEQAELD